MSIQTIEQTAITASQAAITIQDVFQPQSGANQLNLETFNTIKQIYKEYICSNTLLLQEKASEKIIAETKATIQKMIQWENQNDNQVTSQQYTGSLDVTKQKYNDYYQHLIQIKQQLVKLQQYWNMYQFDEVTSGYIKNVQSVIQDMLKFLSEDLIYDLSNQQSSLLTLQGFSKAAQTILLINGIKYSETNNSQIKQQILNELSKISNFREETVDQLKDYLIELIKPIEKRVEMQNYNMKELKEQVTTMLNIVNDTVKEIQQTSAQVEMAEGNADDIITKGLKVQKLERRLQNAQQQGLQILELSQVQDQEVEFTKHTIEEEIKQIQTKLDKAQKEFQNACIIFNELTMYQTYDILISTERTEAYSVFQQINDMIQQE